MRVQPAVYVHDSTIDQIEYETVTPAVSDDALVTPGTLTVALDTSDAPQAMQDADGELTGMRLTPPAPSQAAWALRSPLSMRLRQVPRSATKGRYLYRRD
ncbi:MAG: hypothetical protein ACLU0O_03855 [Collinsella sp.]